MTNVSTSPVAVRTRTRVRARVAALSVAAAVTGGIATHHLTQPTEPKHDAMGPVIPAPCDDFADCVYTAYWYYFLR